MNYDRYYTCDVVNGEGLRVTLFVTGCEHACPGCYNTSCWNRLAGKPFTPEVRDGVLDLCRDHDGLSLSGGDPLLPANREAIADLCLCFKQRYPEKDIWLWTGYLYEDVRDLPLLRHVDVLIDGRYVADLPTTQPWRGSDNQRLIRLRAAHTADAFSDEIRFALKHAASSETISALLDQACTALSPECSRTRLLLALVDVCLESGRSKQARYWLDAMDSEVAPTDLLPALSSALAMGHLHLVLDLGQRLVLESEASPQERLQVAKDVVMLAKKLRMPYGRNGVWQSHIKLLRLASDLLGEDLISHPHEPVSPAAQQLRDEIEQMKNCKPRPKSALSIAS